ncbi:MAG: hypothetical protein WBE72_16160 [Terracidiphilus sp.]
MSTIRGFLSFHCGNEAFPEAVKDMTNNLESEISQSSDATKAQSLGWLKIGVLTAISALAGGVAAAWWYRKTLTKLRETGEISQNSQFGILDDPPSGEPRDEI